MIARRANLSPKVDEGSRRRSRFWRYGPLFAWMILILVASTGNLSASNTSRIVRPLLVWLFPDITEASIRLVHFYVRKTAHFTEYAVFAFLAARAFAASSHDGLRRGYFYFALLLISVFALADEFHQSFTGTRTGSIYDSLIDISGGLTALVLYALWRGRARRKAVG